jgi:hypothetical protein
LQYHASVTRAVSPATWQRYVDLRFSGMSRTQACSQANLSYGSAQAFDRGDPKSSGHVIWRRICRGQEPFATEARMYAQHVMPLGRERNDAIHEAVRGSISTKPANELARLALEDFSLFRPRYLGREASATQAYAAERIVELLQDAEDSFAVMNCPPGWGKSTLIHDIEAWITARRRSLRGINGSRGEKIAAQNTARLKRTLERTTPLTGAAAAMSVDFGIFKPPVRDKWRDDEFIVYQDDGQPTEEKEPTWQSLGMDSTQLGNRANFISWDDLVDPHKDLRTENSVNRQRDFLDDVAETRLEPHGLFMLTMQRLGPEDLSRYCLDMRLPIDDMDLIETGEDDPRPRKYTHICFQAHDDKKCAELGDDPTKHLETAHAQPVGCLLDPRRLSWRKLRTIQEHKEQKYQVQYQQEDLDPDSVLVQRSWLNFDPERGLWSPLPVNEPGISYVTVDPSGTRYWGVQAWSYVPDGDEGMTGRQYLLDLRDQAMEAPDLLDWDVFTQSHVGLLEEWRQQFKAIGRPLKCVVVEFNAFGRWLVQYRAAQLWAQKNGIHFIPHTTGALKTDRDFGIWSHQSDWKFKRIILPGRTPADVFAIKPLTDQVCRWPTQSRQDQVTSYWFGAHKRRDIMNLGTSQMFRGWREERPSWMRNPGLLVTAR